MKTLKLYFTELPKIHPQETHKIPKKKKTMFPMTCEESFYAKSLYIFHCHALYVLRRTLQQRYFFAKYFEQLTKISLWSYTDLRYKLHRQVQPLFI